MTAVWLYSQSELGSRLVILSLANYANEQFESWPSVATLAQHTKLSERQVHRCIKALMAIGELVLIGKNKSYRNVNQYRLVLGVTNCQGDIGVSQMSPNPLGTHKTKGDQSGVTNCQGAPFGVQPLPVHTRETSPHHQLIKAWSERFEAFHGFKYPFQSRDNTAVAELLGRGLTVTELVDIAQAAWQRSRDDRFAKSVKNSSTLWEFKDSFAAIRVELTREPIDKSSVQVKSLSKPKSVFELKTIMQAKEAQMKDIKFRHCSEVATGDKWNDPTAKQKYILLKKEIGEINQKIANATLN